MTYGEMMMMMMKSRSNSNYRTKKSDRSLLHCKEAAGGVGVWRVGVWVVLFFVVAAVQAACAQSNNNNSYNSYNNKYVIIGVSGGLQKGFPDHSKLDYYHHGPPHGHDDDDDDDDDDDEPDDAVITASNTIKAVFLGRALVRGYKAYLDVMEPTHRQYINSSTTSSSEQQQQQQQPLINSNVIPTGCWHHANEYWMYLVDSRQGKCCVTSMSL
jgi:hypothetical protein